MTAKLQVKGSVHGMEQPLICKNEDFDALSTWLTFDGHRRNPEGYAKEVENFDVKLGELLQDLKEDDLLMITADP